MDQLFSDSDISDYLELYSDIHISFPDSGDFLEGNFGITVNIRNSLTCIFLQTTFVDQIQYYSRQIKLMMPLYARTVRGLYAFFLSQTHLVPNALTARFTSSVKLTQKSD